MTRYLPIACLLLLPAPTPASAEVQPAKPARPCSMDAMSEADKQRMMDDYMQRIRSDGKASADAWAREQGHAFRRKLVAEGVCPPLSAGAERQVAERAQPPAGKKPVTGKQGKACNSIRMETEVFPNFGGAPMTLGLVPVCED